MSDLARQLKGHRLTTAQIFYHLPDYPSLIQEYIWQDYDLDPQYPILRRFLGFWRKKIEGRIQSVRIASTELIRPAEFRMAKTVLSLPGGHLIH